MQPALDDKEDEAINEEIMQLEKGFYEQVIFHTNFFNPGYHFCSLCIFYIVS